MGPDGVTDNIPATRTYSVTHAHYVDDRTASETVNVAAPLMAPEMTRAEAVTKIVRHGLAILKIVVIYFGLKEQFRHFFKFE